MSLPSEACKPPPVYGAGKRIVPMLLGAMCLLTSTLTAGNSAYLLAKASFAQVLIKHSWQTTGASPWPWADTRPVARLKIPAIELDTFVLHGASGATLAFGPGWSTESVAPGEQGLSMIGGHRDTHFAKLQYLNQGDLIKVQNHQGREYSYRVSHISVVDSRKPFTSPALDHSRLLLVTCYPFNALTPGGPLRYLVEAEIADK